MSTRAATLTTEQRSLYRVYRGTYGMRASAAIWQARRGANYEVYQRWARDRLAEQRRQVKLNASGLAQVAGIAEAHGVTQTQYLEALMHFAISQYERPGSWEAQGFDPCAYFGEQAFADRWF